MPRQEDELADYVRNAIRQLSGLLSGGTGISYSVLAAEKNAEDRPRQKGMDLMVINEGLTPEVVQELLDTILADLEAARALNAEKTAQQEEPEPGF